MSRQSSCSQRYREEQVGARVCDRPCWVAWREERAGRVWSSQRRRHRLRLAQGWGLLGVLQEEGEEQVGEWELRLPPRDTPLESILVSKLWCSYTTTNLVFVS